jgi:hypothetical protein
VNLFTGTLQESTTALFTGAATFYGNVTLGDGVGDVITATGYFTQARIGTGTTFGHVGAVGADELGVEGDVEIDGTAWFDGSLRASSTALITGAATFYDDVSISGTITSGTWNGTAIDISDYTNLTAGTNITLTGDDLSVDDAFLLNTGDTATGDFDFDSGTLKIDSGGDKVGIASSTPTDDLSIGTASATSTIMMGNFCMYAEDEAGTGVWIKIDLNSSNVFSTSTSPCNN